MRPVYTADDPLQAHIVRNFLESHGVPAEVTGEGFSSWYLVPRASVLWDSPQVWVVNDDDAPRALHLIEERHSLNGGTNGNDTDSP